MPNCSAGLWIERLALTNFRNYSQSELRLGQQPVVLTGANGSGKTNLLEAVSLLSPGTGIRRALQSELARFGGAGDWAIAAKVHGRAGTMEIGTGQRPVDPMAEDTRRGGRLVRIEGEPATASALAQHIDIVWLTPAMDRLFTGPASDRRAFLDRLVLCFDASHGPRSAKFERAMRQRNRLLGEGSSDQVLLSSLETQMAEHGVAVAAARVEAVAALQDFSEYRRRENAQSAFPWFAISVDGSLEADLAANAALDVEDRYRDELCRYRERDRAAARTLSGPHRSDMTVVHGPKSMPARLCSTGEQKALLVGLIIAHATLLSQRNDGAAPIMLLDEIAAHFDDQRRAALFGEIVGLRAQAWLTGTDKSAFAALQGAAQFADVNDTIITLE